MKDNVQKFIRDHNLGQRHFDKNVASHTTAIDSGGAPSITNKYSDINFSNYTSGHGGQPTSASQTRNNAKHHPKSQMLNLSFKKVLEK